MLKVLPKPLTIEKQEKLAKGFQRAFWAAEAYTIGLNFALEFADSARTRMVANAGLNVGSTVAGALRRSQAQLLIAALYYGTKLFAKYGKRTHLIWPKVNESKYTELASRGLNLISSPSRLKEVGLAAMQRERNGGLGLGIEVIETDTPSDQRKAKLAKALDRYSKGLEGVSLAGLTTFFILASKQIAIKASHEMSKNGVTSAVKGLRRKQAVMMISALYWGVRLLGSRRKNMEELFPKLKDNAVWNGAASALGLVASPWRAGAALLEQIAVDGDKPPSELPPPLADEDKPASEATPAEAGSRSDFELAG